MTSFNPPSWNHHLGFNYFLKKSQEITEINIKSSQNAYEMHTLLNFYNWIKKTGNFVRLCTSQSYKNHQVLLPQLKSGKEFQISLGA